MCVAGLFNRDSRLAAQSPPPQQPATHEQQQQQQQQHSPAIAGRRPKPQRQRSRLKDPLNGGTLGGHDPLHAEKMLRFAKALAKTAASIIHPLGASAGLSTGCLQRTGTI